VQRGLSESAWKLATNAVSMKHGALGLSANVVGQSKQSTCFINHRCKGKPVILAAFGNFFCQVCVCVLVLALHFSNMMQPLFLANIYRNLFCFICLTYMSACPLLQDGCSSFDIALEVGKKIKSLQVATCGASSEKDKKLDSTKSTRLISRGTGVVFVLGPLWRPNDMILM